MWQKPKINWTPENAVVASDLNRIEGNTLPAYESYIIGGCIEDVDPPTGSNSPTISYPEGTIFLIDGINNILLATGQRLVRTRIQAKSLVGSLTGINLEWVIHSRWYGWTDVSPYRRSWTAPPPGVGTQPDYNVSRYPFVYLPSSVRDDVAVLPIHNLGDTLVDNVVIAENNDSDPIYCSVYVGVRSTDTVNWNYVANRVLSIRAYLHIEDI